MKIKLPITHLLFRKVSGMVAIKQPEQANSKMNLGLFNENMGSRSQLNFLQASQPETIREIKYNDTDAGNMDVGKGTRLIPDTKDFWVGDPL